MGYSDDDFLLDTIKQRTVAVHVEGDPAPFAGAGADRVYTGIDACCELFLAACADGTIKRWLAAARSVGKIVGLVVPIVVPQKHFDAVISAIYAHAKGCARVLTGDMGIATTLKGHVPVSYVGQVHNVEHAAFLTAAGFDSVRAFSPVPTGALDINHRIDLEMPAFGRIVVSYSPVCLYKTQAVASFSDVGRNCPFGCSARMSRGQPATTSGDQSLAFDLSESSQITLSRGTDAVVVRPKYLLTSEFLDLSEDMDMFGRDTCAVINSSGLTGPEVAAAVEALRHGRKVETVRPLFCTIPEIIL